MRTAITVRSKLLSMCEVPGCAEVLEIYNIIIEKAGAKADIREFYVFGLEADINSVILSRPQKIGSDEVIQESVQRS